MWLYLQKTKSNYLLFTNNLNNYIIHIMEPKKYLKHYHFDGFDYETELYRLLNEWSGRFISGNRSGTANWIVCSPQVADSINAMTMEVQADEWRIEDNSFIQLRPRRGLEYLNLDINITNTDINFL